jgi:predicted secreted protein
VADKYAVAAGGNWSAAGTWSLTDGGAGGAGAPGAAENAFFSNQSGNVVVDAPATCLDLDMTKGTGYTGTLSGLAANTLTISGNATRKGTWTFAGTTTFNATATGKTITNNGLSYSGPVLFSGAGGGWTFQDAFTVASGNLSHQQGAIDTNGFTVTITAGTFGQQTNNARTLTLGASTFNCLEWRGAGFSGLTFNAGTSTVVIGNGPGLQMGQALTFNNLTYTSGQTGQRLTCTGGCTVNGILTLAGSANKASDIGLGSNVTVTGTFKYLGNSVINRLLIYSDVTGTPRTITAAAIDAASNFCDFRDITGAGAAAPFATGSSLGNCLGNSGITFTTPATQTATGTASFAWSTHGWTTRVPLPQDDVVIPNAFVAGRTITCDMPRMGKNVTFSCTGSPVLSHINGNEWFGSLTLASGMTQNAGVGVTWRGRSACTLTNNGMPWVSVLNVDGFGGTLTLQDALTVSGTSSLHQFISGTLDLNGFAFTTGHRLSWTISPGGVLRGRASTITFNQTPSGSNVWNNALGSGSFVRDTSTIALAFTDSVTKTFNFGGSSVYRFRVAGSGTWAAQITVATTFDTLENTRSGAVVILNGSLTQTIESGMAISGAAAGGGDVLFGQFVGATATNHSTPNAAANRITDDLALVVKANFANTSLGFSIGSLIGKWATANQQAYHFYNNGNFLSLEISTTGADTITATCSVNTTTLPAGLNSDVWLAVTREKATGNTKFWYTTIADGQSGWTQLGTTQVAGAGNSIFASSSPVQVQESRSGWVWAGRVYRAQVFNGIPPILGGAASAAPAVDYNPTSYVTGTTWVSATGETWTINGASAVHATNRTLLMSNSGTAFTIAKSGGGQVVCDYVTIRNSTASPGATFFATNSVNAGGNAGWSFVSAIAGAVIACRATLTPSLQILAVDPRFIVGSDLARRFKVGENLARDFTIGADRRRTFTVTN